MICQSCYGKRTIKLSTDDGMPLHEIPCPDCHGGIQHCCEGDREQPDGWAEMMVTGKGL